MAWYQLPREGANGPRPSMATQAVLPHKHLRINTSFALEGESQRELTKAALIVV
jgi:hypothetical protein